MRWPEIAIRPNPKVKRVAGITWKWINKVMAVLGFIFFISIILSFTDLPFRAYYWLGTYNAALEKEPGWVVVMGGGGMPGPDGMIRCYYAADIAQQNPDARIIVAVPGDTSMGEDCPALLMRRELIIRGIDSTRIFLETSGVNTRTQAVNIMKMVGKQEAQTAGVRIVTSPEHMYRAVLVFRKLGFKYVGGRPSFESDIPEQLLKEKVDRKTRRKSMEALNLRYNMWNYLKYEITVAREVFALVYYKMRGWI